MTMRDTATTITKTAQKEFIIALALKLLNLGKTSHAAARIKIFAAEEVCPEGKDLNVSSVPPTFTTYHGVKPS